MEITKDQFIDFVIRSVNSGYPVEDPNEQSANETLANVSMRPDITSDDMDYIRSKLDVTMSYCTHPTESISLARVETCKNCKGETFEKKIFQCDLCGREFSL